MPLGAAFQLERQIQVFQLLLGAGAHQCGQQRRRHFALLLDVLDDGRQAVAQLAQIAEPGFELAQLDVVQAIGRFLAVAGDEGHGGAAVQQLHGGQHLFVLNPDFLRNLRDDFLHDRMSRQPGADKN